MKMKFNLKKKIILLVTCITFVACSLKQALDFYMKNIVTENLLRVQKKKLQISHLQGRNTVFIYQETNIYI